MSGEPGIGEPIRTGTSILLRFVFKYTGASFIAVVAFLLFRDVAWVRGAAGGLGGVAAWFAIRARNLRLAMAAVVSALPLAFWGSSMCVSMSRNRCTRLL